MRERIWFSKGHIGFTIAIAILTCFAILVTSCSLTVPNGQDQVPPPSPADTAHADAGDIWQALACAVESRTIDSTTRLAQYVTVLARNRELSDQDVAAFDAAFPQLTKNARSLTEVDVKTLRELRQASKR